MDKIDIIIYDKEPLLYSIISDVFTFSCFLICMFFSKGSKAWTFICIVLFLFWFMEFAMKGCKTYFKRFTTVKDLKKYVEQLEQEEKLDKTKSNQFV